MDHRFWETPLMQWSLQEVRRPEEDSSLQLTRRAEMASFVAAVHGRCRNPQCRSAELVVLNDQRRSADEGMTEIVRCTRCGSERRRAA